MNEQPANQQPHRNATPATSPNPGRSYDPGIMLEALIRTLGYRGTLRRAWLRPAGMILAGMFILALGVGAVGAIRMAMQSIALSTQASAAKPFTLNGVIKQMTATQWVVAQVPVTIDQQTVINGLPVVGASALSLIHI